MVTRTTTFWHQQFLNVSGLVQWPDGTFDSDCWIERVGSRGFHRVPQIILIAHVGAKSARTCGESERKNVCVREREREREKKELLVEKMRAWRE